MKAVALKAYLPIDHPRSLGELIKPQGRICSIGRFN